MSEITQIGDTIFVGDESNSTSIVCPCETSAKLAYKLMTMDKSDTIQIDTDNVTFYLEGDNPVFVEEHETPSNAKTHKEIHGSISGERYTVYFKSGDDDA